MKKTALVLTLLALVIGVYVTASYSARPPGEANIPDVTGNYEGSNTRFFPETLTVVKTWKARFFIWGQDGNHFWGSVTFFDPANPDPNNPGGWKPSGYINGVILPDNTMYFVNYNATYTPGADPPFSNISPATAISFMTFTPESRTGPKKFDLLAIRPVFGSNVTSIGTYTNSPSLSESDDLNPHP
jgi:hypothetical protein